MKKLSIALVFLLLAFGVFAGDLDDAAFSISGSATTTFGVDLMSQATGFDNTLTAYLRLNFLPASTALNSGSEAGSVYGEIMFDEISVYTRKINNTDDNDADLEMDIDLQYAKLIGPNWWLSVKSHDSSIDYENATQNGILGVAAAWDSQMDNTSNSVTATGGFEGGYSIPDIASIELSLFSLTDWTAVTTDADKNAYGVKAEVALDAVENLTLKGAVNTGFNAGTATALNDDLGFGGYVAYSLAISDDISITPNIGVDAKMLDTGGMNLAIGNGVKISLPGSEITAAEDCIADDAGTSVAWDDGVNSGLTLGWSYYMPEGAEAQLGVQAHVGLSMIENLQIAAGVEMTDVLASTNDIGFAVYGQYTTGALVPYAGIFMLMDDAGADNTVAEVGVSLNDFLPLTSLDVVWNSGNLSLTEPDLGIVKVSLSVAY